MQKLSCTSSSKKSSIDEDDLGNYRPISHLSFVSRLTERVVTLHLANYLFTNNLLNSFQSAYIKHTETTPLSVIDHYHQSYESSKVACLTLLDLYVAFDTIILLQRFSYWFGISSTALSFGSNFIY